MIQQLTEASPISMVAGNATITLSMRVVAGAPQYRVETVQGQTLLLERWTRTFADEATARAQARRAALAFLRFETALAISQYGHRLRDQILAAVLSESRINRSDLAALESELASVINFSEIDHH